MLRRAALFILLVALATLAGKKMVTEKKIDVDIIHTTIVEDGGSVCYSSNKNFYI